MIQARDPWWESWAAVLHLSSAGHSLEREGLLVWSAWGLRPWVRCWERGRLGGPFETPCASRQITVLPPPVAEAGDRAISPACPRLRAVGGQACVGPGLCLPGSSSCPQPCAHLELVAWFPPAHSAVSRAGLPDRCSCGLDEAPVRCGNGVLCRTLPRDAEKVPIGKPVKDEGSRAHWGWQSVASSSVAHEFPLPLADQERVFSGPT